MKRVITYGTFDILHVGHINLLKRAKELGSYLMVGLSTDEFNTLKHKTSFMSFQERKIILESIKYVDFVFPETSWNQKQDDIKRYKADIFVMGDDWKGEFDNLKAQCSVKYLSRTPAVSTTYYKKKTTNAK